MFAFGLEESGHYEAAEAHGLAAVEANPDDVWAIHAVVTRLRDAGPGRRGHRASSAADEADWGARNLFTVHNWWHLALYLLEAGRRRRRARHLRRRGPPRRLRRRAARDARRQRPAVAALPRRRRHRRPVRRHRRRVGDAFERRSRGTCSTTCTPSSHSPVRTASTTPVRSCSGSSTTSRAVARRPEQHRNDRGDRSARRAAPSSRPPKVIRRVS